MRNHHLAGLLVLLFNAYSASTQSLYPISLDEKVIHSSLVVEGKVVAQESFWNAQHTMIYTTNKVEVTKIFKGSLQTSTVEIMTVGGSVGNESVEASDLLVLSPGETGIFFCNPNPMQLRSPQTNSILLDVFSSSQGFISYSLHQEKASSPFEQFDNITEDLYPTLQSKTGRAFKDLNPAFSVSQLNKQLQPQAVSVTGFSPATVNAGALLDPTYNLLTITGSGFGLPSGNAAILFDDANNGPGGTPFTVVYNNPLVVSWTDAQIQVRVPTRAGTGSFEIQDDAGNVGASPSSLNVNFSILTSSHASGPNTYIRESNLMNTNGSGGYTVLYSSNTAGSGIDFNTSTAKATFQRALTTWKEISGFNVIEGGTTSIQAVSGDGLNVVMFDNSNTGMGPLPLGVLGVCYSWNSMCTSSAANQARKTEFDIVVRNSVYSTGATSFTIGPCPPMASSYAEIDLETVILHELGHALNLGHIVDGYTGTAYGEFNPAKLMNYSVVNSVKRVTPDYSAKTAASYAILPQGNTYGSCTASNTEMINLSVTTESKDECPLSFPSTPTPQNTSVSFDLAHATSNKYVDPSFMQLRCDGKGASLTNNAYYALKTNNSGGSLMLSISGYTSNPASLTTCTEAYLNVPVTGVRLSLYQANSCPSAGSFGSPVACRTITGDGALAAITGLASNTNYLIMVEGIENTKASFNLVFSGGALPVKLTEFSGKVAGDHNLLHWKADLVQDVEKMMVQKSMDGGSFEDLAEIEKINEMMNGTAKDYLPFSKTYYRLKIINTDGSIEYSNIIHIERVMNSIVSIYPNPASDHIRIRMNSNLNDVMHLKLYNSTGQLVARSSIAPNAIEASIPVNHLAEGMYQLVVTGKNDVTVSQKVLVKH